MSITKTDGTVKKYDEVSGFIKEHMKLVGDKDGPKYQMNQEDYNKFLSEQGITKDTIKQLATAQADYNNGTIAVLKDLLVGDSKVDKAIINTRTHGGVISTRMTREVLTRTPVTGEPLTKHGVVTIKMNLKSRMDRDLLEACAREIEEAN